MIKFIVHDASVRQHSGTSKRTSKPYTLHFQTVYGHFYNRDGSAAPYPQKLEIILDKDEHGNPKAYAPGEYQLHPSSVYVDREGDLAVAPRLMPLVRKPA